MQNTEQTLFRQQVRGFVDKEIRPYVVEWEAQCRTPREVWQRCGELGFLGLMHPEEFGGSNADYEFSFIFSEEIGRCGSPSVSMGLTVQAFMATPALAKYGSTALRQRYLTPAIKGEMICSIAVTEPDCGSDVAGLKTKAELHGDHYVLNGAKTFITNGIQADFLTLLARTSNTPGYGAFSLLVVPTNLPGVIRSRALKKTCFPASDTAEFAFRDVKVPVDHRIGDEGKGFQYQMEQFQHERLAACIMMLGILKQAYHLTCDYVKTRRAFGKVLVEHQVTRHKLAQIFAEISTFEKYCEFCSGLVNTRADFTKEVSVLKLIGAQVAQRVLDECVQMHGGYGLMEEYEVARYFRDAKLFAIGGGANEIMKEIICKMEGI